MSLEIFHTDTYKLLIQEHICQSIIFLLEHGVEFSIAAEIRHTRFSPPLPHEVKKNLESVVLFVLTGYTFESAEIDSEYFSFEAGFGPEGIGSHVTLPLLAIKQVFVDEYPILINISEPLREKASQKTANISMQTLLKNPENKKLLKKNKKK